MRRVVLLAALAVAAMGGAASAQEPGPAAKPGQVVAPTSARDSALEAQTTRLASELRCPVCQGLSIQESPSEISQQMRALVKEQLSQGKTPDDVRAYFVSKYGEWILLAPAARGFNWFVYLFPAVLLVGGAGFIALLVRRWTTPAPEAAATAVPAPGAPPESAE